jgi:hypothetical protein
MNHNYISKEIFGKTYSNEFLFMIDYYHKLSEELKSQTERNSVHLRDTYWVDFADIVNSYDYLSSRTIRNVLNELRHIKHKLI